MVAYYAVRFGKEIGVLKKCGSPSRNDIPPVFIYTLRNRKTFLSDSCLLFTLEMFRRISDEWLFSPARNAYIARCLSSLAEIIPLSRTVIFCVLLAAAPPPLPPRRRYWYNADEAGHRQSFGYDMLLCSQPAKSLSYLPPPSPSLSSCLCLSAVCLPACLPICPSIFLSLYVCMSVVSISRPAVTLCGKWDVNTQELTVVFIYVSLMLAHH